jgi:phosphocarrier protein HPr
MKSFQITVADPVGLHARPAAAFVKMCGQFSASIRLRNISEDGEWVNGKSMLSLLTAGVKQYDRIEVALDGIDEDAAAEQLQALVRSDFQLGKED